MKFAIAPEGWYGVLKNPSKDNKAPVPGDQSAKADLFVGRKVNLPGPFSFALHPGQMVKIIPGHNLHSNQYLLTRVYDEKAAKDNAGKAIAATIVTPVTAAFDKLADDATEEEIEAARIKDQKATDKKQKDALKEATKASGSLVSNLAMGALDIIKGTDVSFYIPPTGIEIVPDEDGDYIRNAVTLERLEYCILVDESGEKRYERGPQVVFPEPTEQFVVSKAGKKKFRAFELNDNMGVNIKVIADYTDDGTKKSYKAGEELFITGKETRIYYPRAEHMVIPYNNGQVIHYAVAVPKGEGRYVLDKETGEIALVSGPKMLLENPTDRVIVKRILTDAEAGLWFPNNVEALQHNRTLREASLSMGEDGRSITEDALSATIGLSGQAMAAPGTFAKSAMGSRRSTLYSSVSNTEANPEDAEIEKARRKNKFTPPREITLDTKYDGAVTINVWPGYAVQRVSRSGEREVVIGPKPFLMEYDETLQHMSLSTGKPKTDDNMLKTCYLRVQHNRVSDIIKAETADLVTINVPVSLLINFTGKPEKWFAVDDYVKLVTQHCRSLVRNAIKKLGVQEVSDNITDIIRDTILGVSTEDGRPGLTFEENGAQIYDVEVLDCHIGDHSIEQLLVDAQHTTVQNALQIAAAEKELEVTTKLEETKRKTAEQKHKTNLEILKNREVETSKLEAAKMAELKASQDRAAVQNKIDEADLATRAKIDSHETAVLDERAKIRVASVTDQFKAVSPKLIEALIASGNKDLATVLAENLPKADGQMGHILGLGGISSLIQALDGTPIADALRTLKVDQTAAETDETQPSA